MKSVLAILQLSCLALAAAGCAGRSAAFGGTAPTAIAPTPPTVSFTQVDRDHDARVTREELARSPYRPGRPDAFDAADLDHDGTLTLDEWQALVSPARAPAQAAR